MRPRSIALVGLASVTLLVLSMPAGAYQRPGRTEWLSATPAEAELGDSWHSAISADGRLVAFGSRAELLPVDDNGVEDLYLLDRETDERRLLSAAPDGAPGNRTSYGPAMTPDGRFVAFTSHATNLVANDTNDAMDVFVVETATGDIERVSISSSGIQSNRRAFDPDISDDGRYVLFTSGATNLDPPDTNGDCEPNDSNGCDVFVHDRVTGVTERVSEASDGTESDGPSVFQAEISGDGRYVAFGAFTNTLVPADHNPYSDIFVKDRQTGNIERVSVTSSGGEADAGALGASISADGRYVAFETMAHLVPGDSAVAQWSDVFVHDRVTRTTERVSVSSEGVEGNHNSNFGRISDDGRYVLFSSTASNLVPGDTNREQDAFVHDRLTGVTERVSVGSDGAQANNDSFASNITPDGRYVTYDGFADNLAPGDQGICVDPLNGQLRACSDIFLRDRGPELGIGALTANSSGDSVSVSGWATFGGRELTHATDPRDAGDAGQSAGGDLLGVSVVQRPELEDLLIDLSVVSMGGYRGRYRVPGTAGPGVVYGLAFRVGASRYEIRATRTGATSSPAAAASTFGLYRCEAECTKVASLQGGIGTTGDEVRVSLPLEAVGAGPDASLTDVRAFTALGEATVISTSVDSVNVPDIAPQPHGLLIEMAGTGSGSSSAAVSETASPEAGVFSGTLDTSGLAPGTYQVRVSACLGDRCETAVRHVEVGS